MPPSPDALYSFCYQLPNNIISQQFAGAVDVLAKGLEAEIHPWVSFVQQHPGNSKTPGSLLRAKLFHLGIGPLAFAVRDEYDVGVLEAAHLH